MSLIKPKVLLLVLAFLLVWGSPGVGPGVGPGVAKGSEGCAGIYAGVGKPAPIDPHPATELCRLGYILSYNPETRVADWVMERLTPALLTGEATRKSSRFKPDPELKGHAVAGLSDYKGSGYDRGHLAPAGDMKWDQMAMDQSFYFANIAPQVGIGFNRRIWKNLEDHVRTLTRGYGDLVVITGPVFYDYEPTIGNGVVVPDAFFKVIYAPKSKIVWSFLIPNQKWGASDLAQFSVSVRHLEEITGYNFFPAIALQTPANLESTTHPSSP